MPDFLNDVKDKALDVWRRAPTVVVVCGVGLLLLCSTCCLCGGCMGSFFGSSGGGDREGATAGAKEGSESSANQEPDRADTR
jgi:hypothetical protein